MAIWDGTTVEQQMGSTVVSGARLVLGSGYIPRESRNDSLKVPHKYPPLGVNFTQLSTENKIYKNNQLKYELIKNSLF